MWFGTSVAPIEARSIQPGQPGDLCVLAAPPAEVLGELDSTMVAATVVGGEVVFERG
jgi:predicted amidohydrolase YtcJ